MKISYLICCLLSFYNVALYGQWTSPYVDGGNFQLVFIEKSKLNITFQGYLLFNRGDVTGEERDSIKIALFNKDTAVYTYLHYNDCNPYRVGCFNNCENFPFSGNGMQILNYEKYIDLNDSPFNVLLNNQECEIFVQSHPLRQNGQPLGFRTNIHNFFTSWPTSFNLPIITASFSHCYDWKEGEVIAQMPWQPILKYFVNEPYRLSIAAIANQGDSFFYSYETPKKYKGNQTPLHPFPFEDMEYRSGYTKERPLSVYCHNQQCNPNPNSNPPRGFSVDSQFGIVAFTPSNVTGENLWLNFRVRQFRKDSLGNYVYVGYSEKTYYSNAGGISDSDDQLPAINVPNSIVACQNDTVRFAFKAYDPSVQHSDSGYPVLYNYYTDLPENAKITLKDSFTKQKEYLVEWVANQENVINRKYKIITQAFWHPSTIGCSNRLGEVGVTKTINLITVPIPEIQQHYETDNCGLLHFEAESLKGVKYNYHWRFNYELDSFPFKESIFQKDSIPLSKKGLYPIKLEVKHSQFGCLSYYFDTIDFQGDPALSVTLNQDLLTLCKFDSHEFEAEVENTIGTPQWDWYYEESTLNHHSETLLFTPDATGKLKVTVEDDRGCIAKDSTQIQVLPTPIVKLQNDTVVCEGQIVTLDAGHADSFQYLWLPDGEKSQKINVSQSGKYFVQVTNDTGCVGTDSVYVQVNPRVPAAFVLPSNVCKGDSFTFHGLEPDSYDAIEWEWLVEGVTVSTNQQLQTTLESTSKIKHRMAYERSGLWCEQEDSIDFNIYPLPQAAFSLSDTGQCLNGNTFTATDQSTGTDGNSYWTSSDGQTGTNNPFEVSFTQTGNYSIKLLVESDRGCKDSLEKQVEVYPHPIAEFTLNEQAQCLENNHFEATLTSQAATNQTLHWGNGNIQDNALNQTYTNTYTAAGSYQISLHTENEYGCTDTASQSITIHPQPEGSLDPVLVCEDMPAELRSVNTGSVNAIHSLLPSGRVKHLNPGGSALHEGKIASIPNYSATLRMESDLGCISLLTKTFPVNKAPEPSFTWVADRHAGNLHFRFTGSQEGDWTAESGESGSGIVWEVGFNDTGMILVTLRVVSGSGCEGEVSELIPVYEDIELYVPNAFSPNADGHNETWKPGNSQFIKEYHVRIWNHWGQMVYQSYNPHQGWNGAKAQQGVYLFIINAKDIYGKNHNVKGTVHLLR